MKSSAKKVELASVDDLSSTEESRQDATLERIQVIPLSELHPFSDHPFSVRDDNDIMKETSDSTAVNLRQQQLKHPTGLQNDCTKCELTTPDAHQYGMSSF